MYPSGTKAGAQKLMSKYPIVSVIANIPLRARLFLEHLAFASFHLRQASLALQIRVHCPLHKLKIQHYPL